MIAQKTKKDKVLNLKLFLDIRSINQSCLVVFLKLNQVSEIHLSPLKAPTEKGFKGNVQQPQQPY